MTEFFFDTYAIFEILRNNPAYARFVSAGIVTNALVIAELTYKIAIEKNENDAVVVADHYLPFAVAVGPEIAKEAALFRAKNKRLNLSYADCIGFIQAKQLGVLFLTGDRQFEKMPNVEFVK